MGQQFRFILAGLIALSACRSTTPGTSVEVVEKGGQEAYVAGAYANGINQDTACSMAVQRTVNAIALRFAQDNDDIGDDVADAVGVDDGEAFLQRYAKYDAQNADVLDQDFNPVKHMCRVVVRWVPPVFVKDAVLKYAEALKANELAENPVAPTPAPSATPSPAPAAPSATQASSAPAAAPGSAAPPPPASVAPAPAPAAAPSASTFCQTQRRTLVKALDSAGEAFEDLAECKRRTGGDDTVCHRYALYVDDAKREQREAGTAFASCLNKGLPAELRATLREAAPTHGATVVENFDDGTRVVWAYSPVDKTAYVFQVSPEGAIRSKEALAANQVQWLREKLGLN